MTLFKGKRCEIDIIKDILRYANKDIKKTRLLYKTNLSYTTFIKYTNFLKNRKFIEVKKSNPTGQKYKTTDNGRKLINDIDNLMKQLR